MTRTVRTTIRPDLDVEVDEAEYLDLSRMGLLVESSAANTGAESAAAPARTASLARVEA